MHQIKAIFSLLQETFVRWGQNNGALLAAALSFYMIFALAPLLVISISIAGAVFGEAAVEGQLFVFLEELMDRETALFVQSLVENATTATAGRIATIISVAILLYGASNVFYQLRMALNVVWRIAPEPENGILHYVRTRLVALFMVVTLGLLFLVAFGLIFVLTALNDQLVVWVPVIRYFTGFTQFIVLFPLMVLLVALLFKMLPDAYIAWRDVWLGAAVTASLLIVGVQVISLLAGRFFSGSIYGAAGSLVVLLYFIFYAAQILLMGAAFTAVYANRFGSQIRPSAQATLVVRESR